MLNFAIQPLDGVSAVQFRALLNGEGHISQDAFLSIRHRAGTVHTIAVHTGMRQGVILDPTSLPARVQHTGCGGLDALVCVAGHQLHVPQTPPHKAADQVGPEGFWPRRRRWPCLAAHALGKIVHRTAGFEAGREIRFLRRREIFSSS